MSYETICESINTWEHQPTSLQLFHWKHECLKGTRTWESMLKLYEETLGHADGEVYEIIYEAIAGSKYFKDFLKDCC